MSAAGLRLLPGNLHETDAKPLMNPRYQLELSGLAQAVVANAIESGPGRDVLVPAGDIGTHTNALRFVE